MKHDKTPEAEPVLVELAAIKRLLILALAHAGTKQGEIAEALGVSQPTVNRMLPKGLKKNSKPR